MKHMFTTLGAVVVLFVTSMVCVVGTCAGIKHLKEYGLLQDLGLGVVVVLFVTSMVCIFLGRSRSTMTSSVSAYRQSPVPFFEVDEDDETGRHPNDTEGEDYEYR